MIWMWFQLKVETMKLNANNFFSVKAEGRTILTQASGMQLRHPGCVG